MADIPTAAVFQLSHTASAALATALAHWAGGTDLPAEHQQEELREHLARATDGLIDEILHEVHLRLLRWPYIARLNGVPLAKADVALLGISSAFGLVADPYDAANPKLVQHLRPLSDLAQGGRPLNETLHSDGTAWPRPNDLTCLMCVRPDDAGGGRSRVLDGDTLLSNWTDTQALKYLRAHAVPWKIDAQLGGGVVHDRIVGDNSVLRWMRYTIARGAEHLGAQLPGETAAALDSFERAVTECAPLFEFPLQPGDLVFLHNRRCLHARTPIANPSASLRLLLRTRVERRGIVGRSPLWEY